MVSSKRGRKLDFEMNWVPKSISCFFFGLAYYWVRGCFLLFIGTWGCRVFATQVLQNSDRRVWVCAVGWRVSGNGTLCVAIARSSWLSLSPRLHLLSPVGLVGCWYKRSVYLSRLLCLWHRWSWVPADEPIHPLTAGGSLPRIWSVKIIKQSEYK